MGPGGEHPALASLPAQGRPQKECSQDRDGGDGSESQSPWYPVSLSSNKGPEASNHSKYLVTEGDKVEVIKNTVTGLAL